MKLKKKELIFFVLLAAAALAAWAFMSMQRSQVDHGSIRITVNGELFGEYKLNKDQKISIGGTNTCRIRNGKAKMIEATCPDHLCIHQDEIGEKGGFIICLPNKVFIEGIPSQEASTDEDVPDMIAQ